jgi:Mobilization protein NikA
MLHSMQQAAASPSPTALDFAGLLAALTTHAPRQQPAWNDDDLAEDVATLSYETALRTHARHKAADPGDQAFTQIADSKFMRTASQDSSACATWPAARPGAREWSQDAGQKSAQDFFAMPEQNRKCASITIRLSKAECEQLRRRAADAGLTVSAYLRSCTFEAEALRAQVKEALAELRKGNATENRTPDAPLRRSRFRWLWWLMHQWHFNQGAARA